MAKEHGEFFRMRSMRAAASRIGVSPDDYASALAQGRKICGGCRQSLPRDLEHFRMSVRGDGLRGKCRACEKRVDNTRYWRDHEKRTSARRAYQQANKTRIYADNARRARIRNAALRAELIAAYGAACACCGEANPIFLDLDHIHNNGNAHRREVGNNTLVALELRRRGWPKDDYQLLCCNCNQGKARNGGVCPHVKNKA
jgi:hypothetical protein